MTEYIVDKGDHDFKPNDQCFFTSKSKIEGSFSLTESMYFTREDPDYSGGNDLFDWNKICGLTWFFSSNSNRAGMLTWRPNEKELHTFEIAAYVNPKSGGFEAKKVLDVRAGEVIDYQLIWTSNRMVFKIKRQTDEAYTFHELPLSNPPWWGRFYRHIGPWFGGNQPAHKEMTIQLLIR